MRIIAGYLGGRLFTAPRGHRTHPMSDKMRGALFNMLGDIKGLTVLDAFSGSGALAYEALSRGAGQVTLIEQDRHAQKTIAENIAALGLDDRARLIKANANSWFRTSPNIEFDLVLLDPPYNALQYDLLELLVECVSANGKVILSWPGKQELMKFPGFTLQSSKNYGDGSLHVYVRA